MKISAAAAALALAALVPSLGRAETSPGAMQGPAAIVYKDDLIQVIDTGSGTDERDVTVTLDGDALTITPKKGPATVVAYASIGSMTYDRRSRVRKMAPTYGRRIQHFLTIQFKHPDGRGDFVEIEMGKDVAPRLVAQLEARSGKTITRSGA